ncbi:hypothetical protein GCM10007161_07910 [Ignatzschineria indica]|uniref:Outer membrane assembly protein BamC n=1 Tax=Ignatzschineria indica TaxID=472583 RepID=A0A2U2ANG0_9GAMM|nr:hypothetical protein DC082_04270 [Ignatzschineria indica]GGZ78897.1 hypothetical protein GCM10007161_07910 [Ignatzschineria indica]
MYTKKIAFAVVLSGLIIGGCSTQNVQSRDNLRYLKSSQVNPLEYPPTLVKQTETNVEAATTLQEYRAYQKRAASKVLPTAGESITFIESEGGRRWINTGHTPDFVWQQVHQLLRQLGLEIESQSPEAGLIETKWAENQADVPEGFIRGLIKRVASNLLGSSSRDKFKIRLEREGDRTLIFVTHYAMKDEATGNDDQFHRWVDAPKDPELEAEFIARLAARLGGDGSTAMGKQGLPVTDREGLQLIIKNRSQDVVWEQVANILDDGVKYNVLEQYADLNTLRVGRTVKKRRFWFFSQNDPEGEVYYIRINPVGEDQTQIDVLPVLTLNHLEEMMEKVQTGLK